MRILPIKQVPILPIMFINNSFYNYCHNAIKNIIKFGIFILFFMYFMSHVCYTHHMMAFMFFNE